MATATKTTIKMKAIKLVVAASISNANTANSNIQNLMPNAGNLKQMLQDTQLIGSLSLNAK